MNKKYIIYIAFALLLGFTGAACASNLYGPSGLIFSPSAYAEGSFGYHKLGSNPHYKINVALFQKAFEAGLIHDKTAGIRSYNLKLPLLSESAFMPQMAVGSYNYKNAAVGQTNYIVMSKYLDAFGGLTFHLGYVKNGDLRDATKMVNYQTIQDAVNDAKNQGGNTFMGFEYSFVPMIGFMGEYQNKTWNGGIRLRPIPALTLDYNFLDLRKERNFDTKKVLNVNFSLGF